MTRLLSAINDGEQDAYDRLLPMIYDELRGLAQAQIAGEAAGHTLQPTALLHEAWMRLVRSPSELGGRAHFFGAVAEAMQRVLVDHARKRLAAKRRAPGERITLADVVVTSGEQPDSSLDLLALDEAMTQLAVEQNRIARVVRLRFFVGLSVTETADALGLSEPTIKRDFAFGRAWLLDRMTKP